jgi:integrase
VNAPAAEPVPRPGTALALASEAAVTPVAPAAPVERAGRVWVPPAVPTPDGPRVSAATVAALAAAVPPETRRAFRREWQRFTTWCAASHRAPLPASEETLTEYIAAVTTELRYAPSTVERMVSAIRAHHRGAGLPAPDSYAARALLRAYRARLHEAHHERARPRRAEPAVPDRMRALLATLDRDTAIGKRDAALLSLGYAIAGRRGELARLDIADVTALPEGLDVAVWRPKTNRDAPVAVPYHPDPARCPVRAVTTWITLLAEHGRAVGPLFVRIDRHGRLGHVATGRGSPDGRLSDRAVANIVTRTARAAALPGRWTGHSLRRGLVTTARRAGKPMEQIARHGGWADDSRALLAYVDEVDRWVNNLLYGLE